ncbi:endolytic transglycosylase MltG [Nocardioides sp. MH1]|uniref:endolytic transglycosylase MltG n=1 Tax=Nocardioides sp. MH1 TaxID=3242490 RepID=UPI00351FCED4
MSDPYVQADEPEEHDAPPAPPRDRRRKRRFSGCLPMLVFVAVLAALIFALFKVVDPLAEVKGWFADPKDFDGPGTGHVCFEVKEGDNIGSVGGRLVDEGVVGSDEAFSDAAEAADAGVFPGTFPLQREMKASDAVEVLADPGNSGCLSKLTFLPGKTVKEIVALLAKNTDFSRAAYEKALRDPDALGLPAEAAGNAEGYLAPGSYEVGRNATPRSILRAMVTRWSEEAKDLDLEGRASDLGYTVHEMMTIASLVEAEGSTLSDEDKARIARVIYNRLENPTAETAGFLQIDSTIAYALGRNPGVALTEDQLQIDSPYNTREHKGLPPGPIDAPSSASLNAALNPAEGDWLYWVTVNLRTGKTKFALDHDEFLQYKAEYTAYCDTSDAC